MRRPRALDNELYGHRRHAPLAAGGVRERMGRNARAIQEIKARLNLVDIARRYVDLKRNGPRWVAPCPFHQETKPSFSINEEEGFFYCFGCQASGDLFDFYGQINGLDFKETLEQLAEEAGVTLERGPRKHDGQPAGQTMSKRRQLLKIHEIAAAHFRPGRRGMPGLHGPERDFGRGGETLRAWLEPPGLAVARGSAAAGRIQRIDGRGGRAARQERAGQGV